MRTIILVTLTLLTLASQGWAADGVRVSTKIPRFDAAVERGLAFLQQEVKKAKPEHGYMILAAYAMVKCGVSREDPFVAEAIQETLHRVAFTSQSRPTITFMDPGLMRCCWRLLIPTSTRRTFRSLRTMFSLRKEPMVPGVTHRPVLVTSVCHSTAFSVYGRVSAQDAQFLQLFWIELRITF